MARHKEFSESKVLQAAMHAFWTQGYSGTSLNDLEASMQLTRTSIYNAFGNKRQLFKRVIEYYQQSVLSEVFALVENADSFREGINNLLRGVIELHFREDTPGGCLVLLSILEREQHDAQTIILLEKPLKTLQKYLKKQINDAITSGELNIETDVNTLASTIVTLMIGIVAMAKAGFSKNALSKVSTSIDQLL